MKLHAERHVRAHRNGGSVSVVLPRWFATPGDTVIYNVIGGIGTLVGPIVGAGFFQLMRELMARLFGDQFPYLIPLGVIFITIIIFLPQGILGFARRWLNR